MKKILVLLAVFTAAFSQAQSTGSVVGKLTDKEYNNESLAFANVLIKGTTKGTTSDFDGLYSFEGLDPGSYTLIFSFVGYETQEINVQIVAGKVTEVNVPMGASAASLDEIVITTTTKKESETALLLEQKKAIAFKTAIGAQELSRKGVGDVAAAVTKVTGISKQEGSGGVFVRGLGDRYNITTLNGLPLPSNNPSKKNIDLDIFSTDIVEFVGIDKTYNTKNYGDFAGANVNIASKNYTGKGFVNIGLESGVNTNAISESDFYLHDGPNYTGFYDKNYPEFPLNNYNFNTSWDRETTSAPINSSISLKGGDSYQLGDDTRINFFAVASFNNEYGFRDGVSRGSVNVSGVARRDYDLTRYNYDTNSTLMGNIGFKHKDHKIKYNGVFINSTSQQQAEYTGIVDIFDYAPEGGAILQRSTFDRTELYVHQLLGDHELSEQFEVNWGAAYNFAKNDTPNRRQTLVTPDDWDEPEGPKSFNLTLNDSDNHRFYQDLEEEEIAANLTTSFKFNKNEEDEFLGKITLGYSGRFKTVDFESTQFNFRIINSGGNAVDQPIITDVYDLDSYFNQSNFNAGLFNIRTFRGGLGANIDVLLPQTFEGEQNINAGFISLEYKFSDKFSGILGFRGEQITQNIAYNTSVNSGENELDQFEYLPSISLKYVLNEKQNLRFAASKTYTLPQFKERAPFQYDESPTLTTLGNPALYSSTNYNADIKWDLFPESDEIISIGSFLRMINNPINQITINSASNDVSWVNSGDWATAIGAEFEIRKNLLKSEIESGDKTLETKLTGGLNFSYLNTTQDLDRDKVIEETTAGGNAISVDFSDTESSLTGASDILVNADLSFYKDYKGDKSIQTTLAFNYFSDRIYALGSEGKGNIIDSGIGTLDFILKTKLNKNLGVGLSAKNLLNPTIERIQETQDVVVSSFKLGANVKLSLSYNF
ncbi:TonB-dependent receptor [Flavivirga aquimarina]|uniref:TonB-dependent receptor n=1 Tax=Flavivirga aquimarina TaxID=2027862 RepID=A0ABT8WHK1_9FLAO|nr:TonB-dependent receptor [Flavivirga aquimarina]MDO5972533.1 TonB-dependent receptor [Flavivirga aquimarina]